MFSCLSPENVPSATTGFGEHLCRASKNQDQIFAVNVQDFKQKQWIPTDLFTLGTNICPQTDQSCLFLWKHFGLIYQDSSCCTIQYVDATKVILTTPAQDVKMQYLHSS